MTLDLAKVFGKAGLRLTGAVETTLTANRLLSEWEATKHKWQTTAEPKAEGKQPVPFETRVPFAFPQLTIRPMEVRTFLADFA